MSSEDFVLWERLLVLTRPAADEIGPALAGLVRALAELGDRTALLYRAAGFRTRRFGGGAAEIAELLELQSASRDFEEEAPFVLLTARRNPLFTLRYGPDLLSPGEPYHRVELSFSLDRQLVGPGGHFSFDELLDLFAVAVEGFGAGFGAVLDSRLLEIVHARITVEEMRRRTPPEHHGEIGEPPVYQDVPRALVDRLARIRHPIYFDLHQVPPAVWWINYWTPDQLAAVGEEKVRSAPWARIREHPSGGLVLVALDEPLVATNNEHLQRVAAVADVLDLYAAQEPHLHGRSDGN